MGPPTSDHVLFVFKLLPGEIISEWHGRVFIHLQRYPKILNLIHYLFSQWCIPWWCGCCFRYFDKNTIWNGNMLFMEFGGTKRSNLGIAWVFIVRLYAWASPQLHLTTRLAAGSAPLPLATPPLPYWTTQRTQRKTGGAARSGPGTSVRLLGHIFSITRSNSSHMHVNDQVEFNVRTFKLEAQQPAVAY